jgi:hypothetical protein
VQCSVQVRTITRFIGTLVPVVVEDERYFLETDCNADIEQPQKYSRSIDT